MPCNRFRSSSTRTRFAGSRRASARIRVAVIGMAMAIMLVPASFALAQHTSTESGHEKARKACSEEARARNLAGNDFDDFVAECVVRAPATQLQQHHQKEVTCNRRATQANVQGDARKRFVDECLRYHPSASADQDKLVQCNQRASRDGLRGERKKKFVDECVDG